MGYALEGWKVSYTRNYDAEYGETRTVVNVTIGDQNVRLGSRTFSPTEMELLEFERAKHVAHLIASAPDLLNALESLMLTINEPEVPAAESARGFARHLLKKLGSALYREAKEQEEAKS